ncbi:hypothetical protein [Verrucosispora sioxanthis]|uniref:Uncharacterized protein n=1 Tax=Verrucosispora sioxanthis TaxID=2499994 RepID=A0A6M1KXL5_9ACTN|nr:hypothetical protein [Verrucosispora sioxanthis]NEE63092.1 hypothetical protein [Verrucosispora sioxanthis]NGM12202.1 hypothetical protein [Verrucosispora sioxanthis]
MRGVTRIVSILTVGLLLATGMTAPASADFDPNDCYMVGAAEYVDFRAMVWDMVQAGELTTDEAFYLSCDPRRASERVSYDVEVVRDDEHRFVERDMPTLDEAGDVITVDVGPVIEGLDIIDVIDGANAAPAMAERVGAADGMAVAAATSGCRMSTRWTITQKVWGKVAFGHRQTLNWCWNKSTKKVRDWTGECSGYTTGWGTANGWQWDGCSQNDFIGYTLNGSHPGGVHHITQGKFTHMKVGPTVRLRLDLWGHWDSTCDAKYNKTLRNYC